MRRRRTKGESVNSFLNVFAGKTIHCSFAAPLWGFTCLILPNVIPLCRIILLKVWIEIWIDMPGLSRRHTERHVKVVVQLKHSTLSSSPGEAGGGWWRNVEIGGWAHYATSPSSSGYLPQASYNRTPDMSLSKISRLNDLFINDLSVVVYHHQCQM